jgi:hypothetical protein
MMDDDLEALRRRSTRARPLRLREAASQATVASQPVLGIMSQRSMDKSTIE